MGHLNSVTLCRTKLTIVLITLRYHRGLKLLRSDGLPECELPEYINQYIYIYIYVCVCVCVCSILTKGSTCRNIPKP